MYFKLAWIARRLIWLLLEHNIYRMYSLFIDIACICTIFDTFYIMRFLWTINENNFEVTWFCDSFIYLIRDYIIWKFEIKPFAIQDYGGD